MWSFVVVVVVAMFGRLSSANEGKMEVAPMKPSRMHVHVMPPSYHYQNSYWIYEENDTRVSAYDREKQRCCSGSVFTKAPNSYFECCGSSQYDTTRQKCCNGAVHDLRPGFGCCDTEYFSIKEAICCLSPVSGNYTLKKFPPNVLGNAEAIQHTQCCGLKLYDTRSQICCTKSGSQATPYGGYSSDGGRGFYNYYSYNNGGRRFQMMMERRQEMDSYHFMMIRRLRPKFVLYDRKYKNSGCCNGKLVNNDEKKCPFQGGYSQIPQRRHYSRPAIRHFPSPPSFGTCNKERYNMQTHVCCTLFHYGDDNKFSEESKLHEKTLPNNGCCGTEIYDQDNEICCNNRVIHKQNEEATLECCGNNTFDTATEQCCDLATTVLKLESLEEPNDSCCGSEKIPYNSHTQICCGNKVLDLPKTSGHKSRSSIGRMSNYYCCWNSESNSEPSLYNPRTEMCCDGVKHDNKGHRKGCCASQVLDWSKELCCDGKVYNKTSSSDSCCGSDRYNTRTHICCDPNSPAVAKQSRYDNCCGKKPYDYQTQVCCRKGMNIRPSMHYYSMHSENGMESVVYPKESSSTSCCGMQIYNMQTHQCCASTLIQYEKELCCSYRDEYNTYKTIAVQKVTPNAQCCGKDSFDPDTERCCNQTVVQASGLHLQCCGSSLYDSEEQICCNGHVHNLGEDENLTCCGKSLYKSNTQLCCRGAVKDIKDSTTESCCYQNNDTRQDVVIY